MQYTGVLVKNFRNLEQVGVSFNKNINIFIGDNGQGKTNLLESLYFCSKGISFRPGKIENLVSKKSKTSLVKTKIIKNNLEYLVQVQVENSKKNIFVNSKKSSSSKLVQNFQTILFSPESLSAIKNGPEERRLLLDELLITHNPQNTQVINDYKKALRARNKFLKDYKSEKVEKQDFWNVFDSLNKKYLPLSAEISFLRAKSLEDLKEEYLFAGRKILNDRNVDISVDYLVSNQNTRGWQLVDFYDAIEKRYQELEKAEVSTGISLVGPHKHDIRFIYDNEDSRYYCSQGQQRALILAFKMAQIDFFKSQHGEYPVLMLDDVMSELDLIKQECLIGYLKNIEAQIFLTTTDLNLSEGFVGKELSLFKINQGQIIEQS